MVGMASSFDNPTPHGGPPFHGWKNGWGFGHARGPGQYWDDPSIPSRLSMRPGGDRDFASTAFWRRRAEVGQANSFGIGDRPNYGLKDKDNNVSPDAYGDITPALKNAKRNPTRAGIKLKAYYPPLDEKIRNSGVQTGPGPARYDIRIPPGQGSWKNPVTAPAWSMQPRQLQDQAVLQSLRMPGPAEYTTRITPGMNSPIRHCPGKRLYDISMLQRLPGKDGTTLGPGPAGYTLKGKFDEYGLITKIMNVKVPRHRKTQGQPYRQGDTFTLDSLVEEEDSDVDESASHTKGLTRVESSPV